jgi:catechol 2,3-dioxygenase-like lactoylglutathione lyase family enzyme
MSMIASPIEFHLSFRVSDLKVSTSFYSQFLGVEPKDRAPRFSTFFASKNNDRKPT